jgi:hypothetical protein
MAKAGQSVHRSTAEKEREAAEKERAAAQAKVAALAASRLVELQQAKTYNAALTLQLAEGAQASAALKVKLEGCETRRHLLELANSAAAAALSRSEQTLARGSLDSPYDGAVHGRRELRGLDGAEAPTARPAGWCPKATQPADWAGLPNGSYARTCAGCVRIGDTLSCDR